MTLAGTSWKPIGMLRNRHNQTLGFTQGRALVLVGATGLGKTHLSVGVGLALLKRGYTVRFPTAQALLTRVVRAPGLDGRAKVLKPYHASDVLILDEFGYLPADPDIGPILYEVIATRYEKKATLITSSNCAAACS
jgi:DNA replication protein DnaC